MNSEFGSHASTYQETIARLKTEIQKSVEKLKAADAWPEVERDYRALIAVEELAGVSKTTLDRLLGISSASEEPQAPDTATIASKLAVGEQESEMSAEIEKGS